MRSATFPAVLMAAIAGLITVELMTPVPTRHPKPQREPDFAITVPSVPDEGSVLNFSSDRPQSAEVELEGAGE